MIHGGSRPIVVFGDDWGRRVSSLQHVFRWIIQRRSVVWVNGIGHRVPRLCRNDLKRAWEKGRAMLGAGPYDGGGLAPEIRPAVIVRPAVLPWHHRRTLEAFNRRSLQGAVRRALRSVGSTAPPVVVTGSPSSASVIGRLGEVASIYFCMDDFSHLQGVSPRMLEPLERRLLEHVSAVVATAASLARRKVPASGQVHYLPQGVSYDHFAAPRRPPGELNGLPRPLIGFAGGISGCCDLALLSRVAEANPHASLVLVGPISVDVSSIRASNVHLLGPRPYDELPAYVQQFQVGLIPYVRNRWTDAVDPLKLLEYLAAGVPVVSTAIPEVEKYRRHVSIARDADAFVAAVSRALQADQPEDRSRRMTFARRHRWERRSRHLLGIIDRVAERQEPAPAVASV